MWSECCFRAEETETIHEQKVGKLLKTYRKRKFFSLTNQGHVDVFVRTAVGSNYQKQAAILSFVWMGLALIPKAWTALKCSGTNKNQFPWSNTRWAMMKNTFFCLHVSKDVSNSQILDHQRNKISNFKKQHVAWCGLMCCNTVLELGAETLPIVLGGTVQ